tara:strand:- start:921 stop:1220 length:300 start_codon:yes stop_codon:yes gene_type:complete
MKEIELLDADFINVNGKHKVPTIEIKRIHKTGSINGVFVSIKKEGDKYILSYEKGNKRKKYKIVEKEILLSRFLVGKNIIILESSEKEGHINYLAEIKI